MLWIPLKVGWYHGEKLAEVTTPEVSLGKYRPPAMALLATARALLLEITTGLLITGG